MITDRLRNRGSKFPRSTPLWLAAAWLLALVPLQSASGAELRVRGDLSLGGEAYDQLADVAVLPNGSVVAVGSTFVPGQTYLKGWVVKVNKNRRIAWELIFREHVRSKLRAVAALPDGDFFVAGSYRSHESAPSLAFLARIDSSGVVRWATSFGSDAEDEAYTVAALADGSAVVAGLTIVDSRSPSVAWAARFDGDGTRIWDRDIDAEAVLGVAALADGDLALAGTSRTDGDAPDLWVVRLTPDGDMRWRRLFGGGARDSANAVVGTEDNGMLIAGETLSRGAGGGDAWLLKLDPFGFLEWDRILGGGATDRLTAIDVFSDGKIATTGTTQVPGTDDFQLWSAVMDKDGETVAELTVGENRDDRGLGVTVTGDRSYIVTGVAQPADSDTLVANGRILFYDLR